MCNEQDKSWGREEINIHKCNNKCFLESNLSTVWKTKTHNIGFPIFRLPACTQNLTC